ncbi:MAG: hypothetical protein QM673_11035 [Gordonia sp. (in: high G+C Gram-positive bacteria)]
MSVRTVAQRIAARVPFGIGTVTLIAIGALVTSVGMVLAIGTTATVSDNPVDGELRDYSTAPAIAWTVSQMQLPGYTANTGIAVADNHRNRWLLSYPSGIGRAFVLVDRTDGRRIWPEPVRVGLGSCAFTASGQVGCAINLGSAPDGFYRIDDTGRLGLRAPLEDTAQVIGVGDDFLRIDQSGHHVSMYTPDGHPAWQRTFAAAATASIEHGVLEIDTADGNRFIVDAANGTNEITCAQCDITRYATGITVAHNAYGKEAVTTYAVTDGVVRPRPTGNFADRRIVGGPSTFPVLGATGNIQIENTRDSFQVLHPAWGTQRWAITDPQLSKANPRPCGSMVAFAHRDRSRVIYRLSDGHRLGSLPRPSIDDPDTNIDRLLCVGSSGNLIVFADPNQLTAFDPVEHRVAWRRAIFGQTSVVDGYLVLTEGTSLTVLRPAQAESPGR